MSTRKKNPCASLEETLRRINLAALLATCAGEEDLFRLVVSTAARIARAEWSLLFVFDSESNALRLRASFPERDDLKEFSVSPGKGLVGNVFVSGQPLIVADLASNAEMGQSVSSMLHDAEDTTWMRIDDVVAVPIAVGEKPMGVLEIVNKAGGGRFDQRDADMVSAFAKIVAISLQDNQTDRDIRQILAGALREAGVLDETASASLCAVSEDPALRRALKAANLLRDIQLHGDRHLAFCEGFLASYHEHISRSRKPGGK